MRPDLLYRLCGVIVQIPPLRERDSDVRLLAEHFLRSSGTASEPRSFSVEAIELIEGHGWPGNVRELKAFVDRLALLVNQSTICADDVVKHLPGLLGQLDERRRIEAVLDANRGDVTKSATALGMSRANLYLKLKKFGVERLPATRSASV
jgi:DNA-binding NtrC family response regulator